MIVHFFSSWHKPGGPTISSRFFVYCFRNKVILPICTLNFIAAYTPSHSVLCWVALQNFKQTCIFLELRKLIALQHGWPKRPSCENDLVYFFLFLIVKKNFSTTCGSEDNFYFISFWFLMFLTFFQYFKATMHQFCHEDDAGPNGENDRGNCCCEVWNSWTSNHTRR